MNRVWIVKKIRTFFLNHTPGSDEIEIDSVWLSRKMAENYLKRITDKYDENLDCWIARFNLAGDTHYKEIELYRVFPMEISKEE